MNTVEATAVRVIIDVVAGVLPNHQEPEYGKRWVMTSDQWNRDGIDGLAVIVDAATTYATSLMLSPHAVNWVRTEWVWM